MDGRPVECEICDQAIRGEVALSYLEQGPTGGTGMRILSALIPENPVGKLLDGLLGAAGMVTAQQARHALGKVIPQLRTMDPTLATATDAGLAMILGGVVQAVSPIGGDIAQPWSTTSISIAQIDIVTRLTGIDLSAPLLDGVGRLNRLDARESLHEPATSAGIGAIDHHDRTSRVRPMPQRVANVAGMGTI